MVFTRRALPALFLASGLLFGNAACSSIYSKATASTPARIDDRLALRLKEAEEQAHHAVTAIRELRKARADRRAAAADLLELQGWEVQRRALAVGDILARMTTAPGSLLSATTALDSAGRSTIAAAQAAAEGPAEPELNAATSELSNAIAAIQAARTVPPAPSP